MDATGKWFDAITGIMNFMELRTGDIRQSEGGPAFNGIASWAFTYSEAIYDNKSVEEIAYNIYIYIYIIYIYRVTHACII